MGLGATALLASCAAPPPASQGEEDKGDFLWPMPPDQPRFAYETALRTVADVERETEQDRMRRAITGTRRAEIPVFEKPSAVVAREGRIYVAETVRRSIVVFDVPRRRVFQFGLRPPATLSKPTALALDRAGRVYVADATLRKVFIYDGLGLHLLTVGKPEELKRPTGVAASPDGKRIYIIDRADNESDDHRVMVYGEDGKLLQELGRRGRREGEFNIPVQAVVTPEGTLHVLDAGNFRVQSFDPEGRFLRSFGGVGTGLGQLARPRGLACDGEGNLYVTDASFCNVQIFTARGELLLAVGRGSRRDLPGRYGLPIAAAVDETGRLYVVDQLHRKVEVIRRLSDREGKALQQRAPA